MYNKLFTKILDSSVWLESSPTRIVWLTLIAAMDEQGFVQFAGIRNVAARARVTVDEARDAIACLEGPDSDSFDADNEGRRIERVPGGWMVLNAKKYRDIVTRAVNQEQTRVRVKRFRERKKAQKAQKRNRNAGVTTGNGDVTQSNDEKRSSNAPLRSSYESVTPSGAEREEEQNESTLPPTPLTGGVGGAGRTEGQGMVRTTRRAPKVLDKNYTPEFEAFWRAYPLKVKKGDAFASWRTHVKTAEQVAATMHALSWQVSQAEWTREGGRAIPHPTTYLNQHRWEDEPSTPVIDLTPNTRRDTVGVANAKALETYRQMKQAQERQVEGANPRRLLDDE